MTQSIQAKKVIFAYIEEPPFAWTKADNVPTGCDVEVALTVLNMIGIDVLHMWKQYRILANFEPKTSAKNELGL